MSDSMWHEARRQERKIKGMLVDYRRRAERRRDFYERIKADPTQFLQIHGRQCKIHLDPLVSAAADSSTAMVPWQGDQENLIDRFDVRAHLDFIPTPKNDDEATEPSQEERQLNYERYRIIAQNAFLGLSEEKFLKQLHIEEQYGYTDHKEKRKDRSGGVAIGFNYDDDGISKQPSPVYDAGKSGPESEHSDSDLDVDLSINVSKMDPSEAHEMNRHGRNFGMSGNDFYSFLIKDMDEAESYRLAKEEEHEKSLYAGRKSRRERRAHREKLLANRIISPPSYAARKSPDYNALRVSRSTSKSPTPDNAGKITYITSFGDDEETPSTSKQNTTTKSKNSKTNFTRYVYRTKKTEPPSKRRRSKSRSRSRSRSKHRSRDRRSNRRKSRNSSSSRSRSSSDDRRRRSYRRRRSRQSSSSSSSTTTRSSSSSSSSSSPLPPPPSIKSNTRSKSESPPKVEEQQSAPKQLPRYYGRKRSDQSSSELSDSSLNNDPKETIATSTKDVGKSSLSIKKSADTSSSSLSIQERLKRKRQALLNRQFKADKIAEMTKAEREKQEQQTREDELREMAIRLRKRQREKRHAYDSDSSSSSSSHSGSSRSRNSKKQSESATDDSSKGEPTKTRPTNRDNEPRKRSDWDDESKYTRRKSPVRYDVKRVYWDDKEDDEAKKKYKERREDRYEDREKRPRSEQDRDRRGDRRSRDDSRRDRGSGSGNGVDHYRSRVVKSLVDY